MTDHRDFLARSASVFGALAPLPASAAGVFSERLACERARAAWLASGLPARAQWGGATDA